MRIDDDRIESIQRLPDPRDKKSLQSFLGVLNYVRQFIPNLSELTEPLRELLRKGIIFRWTEVHSGVVKAIKEKLISARVLRSFDPDKTIVIQTDASKDGLGSCLLQDGFPVSYASRSLSDTEKRYAQVEKEFLAITFACKKFHLLIYGRSVEVKSDHEPLISIMQKDIHKIPSAKLQRMRLKLLNYDLKVEYVPEKYLQIADYLSRNYLQTINSEEDSDFTGAVLAINITSRQKEWFVTETDKDSTLRMVSRYCLDGWPSDKSKVSGGVLPYFKIRNDLFIEDGVLYYGDRIIVPLSLRKYILSLLHEAHLGINKTRARAREIFYWPLMNLNIEAVVQNCLTCNVFSKSTSREPLIPHDIPNLPFSKVCCDILEYESKSYLVMMDYFSKWIELKRIKKKDSREIIRVWIEIFSFLGVSREMIADNVPFNSFECKDFAKRWGMEIVTSSPRYPKSNGQAESAVRIAKGILKKSTTEEDVLVSLLEYRNTPTKDIFLSPAQLLCSRRLRTKVPIASKLLRPKIYENAHELLVRKSEKNKVYYDRGTKEKPDFAIGQKIFVQNHTNKQ